MQTYSAVEAGNILGVSEDWLQDLARRRKIPHRMYARKLRFTDEDLAAIIAMYFVAPVEDEPEPRGNYRNAGSI